MSSIRWYRLLIVASLVLPALVFVLVALVSRSEALREGRARVVNTVAVLHEHARKVFETEELLLGRVADRIHDETWEQISAPETSAFLARLKAPLEQTVSIWIADSAGVVRAGSQPWDRSVGIAGRKFFEVQREQDAGTYVSAAFTGKATGTASFAISQRLPSIDGAFNGTLHVSLNPAYFSRFFTEATPGLVSVGVLLRADGAILAREPGALTGRALDLNAPLMRAIASHPEGGTFTAVSIIDGVERVNAYRKVASYPVYVVLGVDRASLLQRWRANLVMSGIATSVASVLLVLLSLLAMRGAKAQQVATDQLRTALIALQHETVQRQEAEQRVRDSQKMEAVGQLTGGIAHDFNNLLTAVLGSLQLLRKRLPPDDERVNRLLDNAFQGATRGAALTQRLLAFGRRQALNAQAVDIPDLVRGMADLLASSVGVGIAIQFRFPAGLAPVRVDANQLELAILNLAVNARDAMANGGTITMAGREEPAHIAGNTDSYVVLSITDTGTGMDPATLAHAMEPFFTTKGVGKGTGLGLSMVHGLAGQSGGWLALHSELGKGTTAELWLPQAGEPAVRGKSAEIDVPAEVQRRRSVLLVDDDPLVLASVTSMLEDMGHSVVQAESGSQALECLRAGASVDLVVSDQAMPGMTGLQLVAVMRQHWPKLPVLLATGYAEMTEVSEAGLPLLGKPFDQVALAEAIGKL